MKWIKTSEELPPIDCWVVCWWANGYELLQRINNIHFASGSLRVKVEDVKYWLPLIKPE